MTQYLGVRVSFLKPTGVADSAYNPRSPQRDRFPALLSRPRLNLIKNLVNIHSHLWAALLFLCLFFTNDYFVVRRYEGTTWVDSLMFSIFLASAVFCMSCSSFYHMAQCHSRPVCLLLLCLTAYTDRFLQVEVWCHAFDLSGIIGTVSL